MTALLLAISNLTVFYEDLFLNTDQNTNPPITHFSHYFTSLLVCTPCLIILLENFHLVEGLINNEIADLVDINNFVEIADFVDINNFVEIVDPSSLYHIDEIEDQNLDHATAMGDPIVDHTTTLADLERQYANTIEILESLEALEALEHLEFLEPLRLNAINKVADLETQIADQQKQIRLRDKINNSAYSNHFYSLTPCRFCWSAIFIEVVLKEVFNL